MFRRLKFVLGLIAMSLIVVSGLIYADNDFIIHDTVNGTITVYTGDFNYGITIQDKNLGASVAGTGEASYGYYFQRGNNHGHREHSESFFGLINWDDSYENHGYDGEITKFINTSSGTEYLSANRDYWMETSGGDASIVYANWTGNNLWGGGNDSDDSNPNIVKGYDIINHVSTNLAGRQGPCDTGYHIASAGERQELVRLYAKAVGYDLGNWDSNLVYFGNAGGIGFSNDLKLPLQGYLNNGEGGATDRGFFAFYWSSTPHNNYRLNKAWSLIFGRPNYDWGETDLREQGNNIRCFKNEYIELSKFYLTFDSQGGSEVDTGITVENKSRIRPANPTKSGYTFVDWYTSTGYEEVFDFTTLATGDLTVYAKWGCNAGYTWNDAGTGCELVKVQFDANGGSFGSGETVRTATATINKIPPIRYSHTSNINDNGVASSVYANNLSTNDIVNFPGATSLDIEVRFSTESASYDWLAIYPAGITPTAYNYSSATISNGKLAGHGSYISYSKPNDTDASYHRNFTVMGDTAQFYFKSDTSTAYYGYYAIVEGVGATPTYECAYDVPNPVREGYAFDGWYIDTGFTQKFDISSCQSTNTIIYAKWYQPQENDIVIEATATETNQTLRVNKYFNNAYRIYRGDGTTGNLTYDTTHAYATTGTYTIILSTTGDRWTFKTNYRNPLVPTNGTTMTGVKIVSMPSLASGFGYSATNPGTSFFSYFNNSGALTSLPEGSFKTENITLVGFGFFYHFNDSGALTSLPEGSFRLATGLITVGELFFEEFNKNGQITSLPEGSFDISNITSVGYSFFSSFNRNGQITSLPEGSFRLSTGLTTVGNYFFDGFNAEGQITSLPIGSFNTENISSATGSLVFGGFNRNGQITSLPEGSFRLSTGLTTVGTSFFSSFNDGGQITSLPTGSFNTENISSVGSDFFYGFNRNGQITSLPDSFKLTSVAYNKTYAYQNAFNSTGYTINKKISDLVSGVTVPLDDRDTFSDNQPGRCGVHPNWLVNPENACNILYDANGGSGTTTGGYMSNATGVEVGSGITLPTREGYTFSGWLDVSGNIVDEVIFPDMDGQTLYANWNVNQYTITFKDGENEIARITADYGTGITPPTNPSKNGYRFIGWEPEVPATMPAEDLDIKAVWERNGSSGGGGGGGGGSSSSSSSTGSDTSNQQSGTGTNNSTGTQNDQTTTGTIANEPEGTGNNAEIQTGNQTDTPNQNSQDNTDTSNNNTEGQTNSQGGSTYSEEFQQAYEFAKGNGITTMPTIQKADMNGNLTRIAMAKMLSQYAMNVLGKTPDTTQNVKFNDVSDERDEQYDNGVTLAYQLGIMGQNMPNNNFRPDDEVTRAEFATALSRMLYATSDGIYKSTSEYYTNHMKKLKEEGIITKDDPKMKELRGYVMIMLMRSAK